MAFTSSGATVSTGVCIYFWGMENSTVRTPLPDAAMQSASVPVLLAELLAAKGYFD